MLQWLGLRAPVKTPDVSLHGTEPGTIAEEPLAKLAVRSPRDVIVFLIHGYNVSPARAVADCDPFRNALTYYSRSLETKVFICSWPGNWPRFFELEKAAYPLMVKNAVKCGLTFSHFIRNFWNDDRAPSHIIIIAHSLGCRLTLETLENLRKSGGVPEGRQLTVVLMAAAVPSFYVESSAHLRGAIRLPHRCAVLHSADDDVLRYVFRPGQAAAFENASEAIGLRGKPTSAGWGSIPMNQYRHGDYWKELETAEKVCRFLGVHINLSAMALPLARRRALAMHRIPTAPPL